MLESVKISRRQSEIRQTLAGLVGKTEPTEDETRQMESLDGEYRAERDPLPRRAHRRGRGAQATPRTIWKPAATREYADLIDKFELRQVALCLDEGRALDGADRRGRAGTAQPGRLPRRAGAVAGAGTSRRRDRRQRHARPDRPCRSSTGCSPTPPRRGWAPDDQHRRRHRRISGHDVVVTAGWAATETGDVAGPTAYATTDRPLAPDNTLGIQMKITRKALKQSGAALEQAVRRDMNGAIGRGDGPGGVPRRRARTASRPASSPARPRSASPRPPSTRRRPGPRSAAPWRGSWRRTRRPARRGPDAAPAGDLGRDGRHALRRGTAVYRVGPDGQEHPGRQHRDVSPNAGGRRVAPRDRAPCSPSSRRRRADLRRHVGRHRPDPRPVQRRGVGRASADRPGDDGRDHLPRRPARVLDRHRAERSGDADAALPPASPARLEVRRAGGATRLRGQLPLRPDGRAVGRRPERPPAQGGLRVAGVRLPRRGPSGDIHLLVGHSFDRPLASKSTGHARPAGQPPTALTLRRDDHAGDRRRPATAPTSWR